MNQIIKDIKNKKELSQINEDYIEQLINKELQRNKKLRKAIEEKEHKHLKRSKLYKQLIKTIRAKLRTVYSVFLTPTTKDREKLLLQLKKSKKIEINNLILSTHLSSKERLDNYEELYKKIFEITKKPRSIIDLGCGLNPFSIPYMHLKEVNYFASDLNKEDCDFIQRYFNISNIKGKTKAIDLTKTLPKLPTSDICFLFKLLESIETKGHKLSEKIIESLPCKYIVISFSTKTISGKYMTKAERGWLERMCTRRKWKFEKFSIPNEVFYVVKK